MAFVVTRPSLFARTLPTELTLDGIDTPFTVEKLDIEDLKAGTVQSTWLPKVSHAAIPADQAEALAENLLAGMTLGISAGALNVSDEWNTLFPEYKFIQPRELLSEAWKGRP